MIPDTKWLDALSLPLRTKAGVLLAAVLIWIFDYNHQFNIDKFNEVYARIVLIAIIIIMGSLIFVDLISCLVKQINKKLRRNELSLRRSIRKKEAEEKTLSEQARSLAWMDSLSSEELQYVKEALRKNTPTFYTYVNSSPVTMMVTKGLVWTTGGYHNQDYYTFTFHDFVWKYIIQNRDRFLTVEQENTKKNIRN